MAVSRRILSLPALVLLAIFLWMPLAGQTRTDARSSPAGANGQTGWNLVVITIDTLRPDHLGCYGDRDIHTPNIDALAGGGTKFLQAYTPVPITLPSHTVIFTGTYPTRSGIHDFGANVLNPRQPTLASVLHDNGYATGAVIGSAVLDSRFGLNHGFDFYYDNFEFNRLQESNLDEMERPGNVVADHALEWLTQNYQKKFFLWMHLYDPHYPYRPPAPYGEQYKTHPYDGEIAFADAQVGRLLDFLREKKLAGRTLVVLSGDHGEGLGEHGEKTHGFFIYDSTLHVPVILRIPGVASAAKEVPTPMSTADLMPTILALLNIQPPAGIQGQNLLSLLRPSGGNPAQRSLYAETFLPRLHFNWSELRGVQTERYHFIDAPKPELYDLSRDPGELNNPQKRAVADELQARLATMIREYTPGEELAARTGLDPALMERLKSLGYAGFSGGASPTISDRKLPDPKDRIATYELISQAMSDSQHGNIQESQAKLISVLKTEPESVPVHYLLGIDYYRMKEFAKSVEEFQHVLKLSPDYSLAVFYLGLAYARAGDPDHAIATLKRTLELDSTNFTAAYNLGAAYLQKQMAPEATAAFRQAIAINPDYAPGHRALGEMLLYAGQADEGIAELRQAEKLEPADAQTHAALAKALEAKGLTQEAQEEMRRAQEKPR
jgi:arylsulfatase A-like enzyme/cytochrome c-type biogenesis protein CcmH/NrfG